MTSRVEEDDVSTDAYCESATIVSIDMINRARDPTDSCITLLPLHSIARQVQHEGILSSSWPIAFLDAFPFPNAALCKPSFSRQVEW